MKINYDVCMLMKSVKICDGYVMFAPVHAITGTYHEDEGYFETLDGYTYYNLDNYIGDLDLPEDFMCAYILKGNEFYNKFLENKNLKQALTVYKNEYTDFKLIYYDEKYNTNKCIQFSLEDFSKLNNNLVEETVSIDGKDDEIGLDLDIGKIPDREQALLKFVDCHKDDDDILNSLWVTLNETANSYVNVIKRITDIIRERNGYSDNSDKTTKTAKESKENDVVPTISKEEYYQNRKKIIKELKEVIKGHDKEIERFVIEIFRLRKQYGNKNKGILLTGSTGVGKTKMCELISEKLDIPCKIIDSTQLTMPGYKGKDIEDFLEQLYDEEKGNLKRVENSIIVFNEIDKKGSFSNYDVSGKGVLNQLLSFMDGTLYTIKDGSNYQHNEKVVISTKNMIVVFSGSFSSIYQNPKFSKNRLGFNIVGDNNIETSEATINDYVKLGGMPDEAIGRFPVRIHLKDLTKEDLKEILLNSKESPIKYSKLEFMGEAGVELEFTNEAIDLISEVCFKEKTGARSLNGIVENCTSHAFLEVTDNIGMYKKVIITDETVLDNTKFQVEKSIVNNKKYILNK